MDESERKMSEAEGRERREEKEKKNTIQQSSARLRMFQRAVRFLLKASAFARLA